MQRLKEIEAHLKTELDGGGVKAELHPPSNFFGMIENCETTSLNQKTETGILLYEDAYSASLIVFGVDSVNLKYIKFLLSEWFRENGDSKESWKSNAIPESDELSEVTIDLQLVESVHATIDAAGLLEIDGVRYSFNDQPTPTEDFL